MSREPQYLIELAGICKNSWNDKQLKVIRETALGEHNSQREIADHLNIDPSFISRLKKHPDFWPDVLRVADHYYGAADIEIDKAVIQAAKGYTYKRAIRVKGKIQLNKKEEVIYEEITARPDTAAQKLWYERRRKLIKDTRIGNIENETLEMEVTTTDAADMKTLANEGEGDNEG